MRKTNLLLLMLGVLFMGASGVAAETKAPAAPAAKPTISQTEPSASGRQRTAIFAGGCFWCMQPGFDAMAGVISTRVGYTGGTANTANYDAVSRGNSGHVEVIEIIYNPAKVGYDRLLQTYWENIDPTDGEGQFADRGSQYKPAIYVADAAQQKAAEKSRETITKKFAPKPIVVAILPATPFFAAEEYHQKYYEKNSVHYNLYKYGSGRAGFLKKVWGEK